MTKKVRLKTYNFTFIDFCSVITDCSVDITDDLYKYKLLDKLKFNNKDTKKVFYYYIIKRLCDLLIKSKDSNKLIFFFSEADLYRCKLNEYTTPKRFKTFIASVVSKLKTLFPIKFYISEVPFVEFDRIIICNTGEAKDIILTLQQNIKKFKIEHYTFSKIKQFIKSYELTYLDNHYFNQVKVKAIIYK